MNRVWLNLAGKSGASCYPKSICGGDSQGRSTGLLPGPMEPGKFCPFGSKDLWGRLKGDCLAGLPEYSARSGREQRYSGLLMLKGCGTEAKWGVPDRTFGPTLARSALSVNGGKMSKIIQDPINGPVKVNGLFEELIDSPEFQRLRYVKQLGLTNLVFPGANHTRFEHSLGTYYIAELMADFFNVKEKDLLLSSALLHDIGHPAMSHSLESFFRDRYGKDHQEIGGQIISGTGNYSSSNIPDILEKHSVDPAIVSEIVCKGSREFPLISSLISGSIDADELDYLRRDAFSTGVAIGLIDHMRILNTIRAENQEIFVEEKGIPSVESLLISRILMYNSVYFHKTCRIAQNMMVSAMSRADDIPDDPFRMNDWELVAFLRTQRNSRALMEDILNRRLLKPVIQVNYTKEISEAIAEKLHGFNDSEVLIDVIPPLSFSGRGRTKSEVKAMRAGKIGLLETFSPMVRSLNETLESRNIVVSAKKEVFHKIDQVLHSLA